MIHTAVSCSKEKSEERRRRQASSLVKWMTSHDSYSCLLFLGPIRREEEEADKFLSKVDDVTGLLQMLLSKDQSEASHKTRREVVCRE